MSWHNYHVNGPFDILVVGDSMAEHAIPPAVLDAWLETHAGIEARTYNLGSSGADYAVALALVRRLADTGRLPPVVLVAVTPPSLTGKDTFETAFAPSPMGSRIAGCGWSSTSEQWLSCQLNVLSDAWAWRGEPGRLLRALEFAHTSNAAGPWIAPSSRWIPLWAPCHHGHVPG